MKKIEEFNKTQMLMEEFEKITNKGPEIDGQIEELNSRTNLTIERLEDEMKENMEDIEFNLDRESVEKEYQKRINEAKKEQKSELAKLNKEKEENSDDKKYFRTDENIKTITMEIKDMKEEIRREELDLKKKDIELQEFYDEEQHENPLRWQEIYNEQDTIRKNIKELSDKIEEYSNFLNELKSIELTPEEYRKMYEREKAKTEPVIAEKIETEQTEVESEKTELENTEQEEIESEKIEPVKTEPAKTEPTKTEPTKTDSTKTEPAKTESAKTEPAKTEPAKTEPAKTEPAKTEPKKVDLKDIKIIISKDGLTIKAPGLNKEDGSDEVSLNLKELKGKIADWKEFYNEEVFLGRKLTDEQFDNVDYNILSALGVLYNSDIDKEVKIELISRYGEAIIKDGQVSEGKSLKEIIEYDRTDLDYLKPRNLISRIIHKKQFDEMKYGADIAEELGIAEIKQDEPGKIRKFFSNIKNKIPLFANKETRLLEEGNKTKEIRDRKLTKDEKALLEGMDKYRNGKVDYKEEIATGMRGKINDFKTNLKELALKEDEEKAKYYSEKINRINENKERANAFATHVTISDGDAQTKEDNEEER